MSKTTLQSSHPAILPPEICEAAGLRVFDKIEWRFQDGEIRGRKVDLEAVEVLDLEDVEINTLLPKGATITSESIVAAIRADREEH